MTHADSRLWDDAAQGGTSMTSEQIRLGVITEIHIVPPGTPEGRWHNPFLFD
jgi:hypothetical protein